MNALNADTNGIKYTVISTFAGCGGSSLGYQWAGFKELLAIDFDKNAVETFKLNFDCPIWERDIKEVTSKEILDFCKIKKGALDILNGSPPCQGFSTAGKRQVNDIRNDLFKEFVRLIDGLQPKVFVMENVSGMVKGKMKGIFIEVIKTLKSLNYQVKCKLMNAMYYNVPQSRQRLIFIGVRNDLNIEPSYPKGNKKLIKFKEAIEGLNINQDRLYPRGKLAILVPLVKKGETASKYDKRGYYFGTHRLSWNKTAPTIIKTAGATMNLLLHPNINAGISINELKRIATFPDKFDMINKYKDKWALIGNSVPPKFMQAIAENIKINILDKHHDQIH